MFYCILRSISDNQNLDGFCQLSHNCDAFFTLNYDANMAWSSTVNVF